MELLNSDYKEKWGKIPNREVSELKKVAIDLYNKEIFCDKYCDVSDIPSIFIPFVFLGPEHPTEPSLNLSGSLVEVRERTIDYLEKEDELKKRYDKELKLYEEAFKYYSENYLESIGFIYEYYDKSELGSVNGYPMFFSSHLLNREDTVEMLKYYEEYEEKRKVIDIL